MIVDKLSNSCFYNALGESFKKAFEYIKEVDFEKMECGIYNIDEDKIFMSVDEYITKNYEDCLWEVHKKYIDIQYIILGGEKIGYTNINNISVVKKYDEKKDILFGEGRGSFFHLYEGEFAIFTPEDAHMPSLKINNNEYVKKVVIKILSE